MTQATRRLVSKVVRFVNADEAVQARWAEALERDHGFDHGEFSGPCSTLLAERECDVLARRYGFETAYVAREAAHLLGVSFESTYRHMGVPALPGTDPNALVADVWRNEGRRWELMARLGRA